MIERTQVEAMRARIRRLCQICGEPCRVSGAALPVYSWPPEDRPFKVCRGIPYVTALGQGSQAWGIHYRD